MQLSNGPAVLCTIPSSSHYHIVSFVTTPSTLRAGDNPTFTLTINFTVDASLSSFKYSLLNSAGGVEDEQSVIKADSITGTKRDNYKLSQKFDVPQYFSGNYKMHVDLFGNLTNNTTIVNLGCTEYPFNIAALSSQASFEEQSV